MTDSGGFTTRDLPGKRQHPQSRREGQLAAGALLQGRYEISGPLGMGGFSAVYQARDLHFPSVTRLCAVKEMIHPADRQMRELAITSFEREASILATLTHPAVPEIYDFFTEAERSYLVLEYIRGQDLEARLGEQDGLTPTELALDWALQLCDVLAYLHQHQPQPVVFRDLKPSNIMLDPHGRVRLIDFGIARVFQAGVKGTMIGTEGYSPPEQYRGEAGPPGDVYALGATLHHLLTGQDPRSEPPFSFSERPIRAANPAVAPSLEAIINRCLAYDIPDRYSDATAVRAALMEIGAIADGVMTDGNGLEPPGAAPPAGPADARAPVMAARAAEAGRVVPVWRFLAEDEIRSTVAVAHKLVFVGAYDSNLYALRADSGEFAWKHATLDGIASSPFVYGDAVLVGSADHHLYSLRASSGRLNWRYQAGGPIYGSPRAAFDHAFFGSDDGIFHAINVLNGRQVWNVRAHGAVRSSPFLADDRIFFGTEEGYIFCVDLAGQVVWQFQAKRAVTSSPAVAEELALVGSLDATIYAIDAGSGWAVWRFRTGRAVVSSPAIGGEIVFIGSSDGRLYALDLFSGRQIWNFRTEGQIGSSPALWGDAVYFGATDGSVYCLDQRRGKLRWRYETGGMVVASPVIVDGIVYIGSCDHHLYALPA
ncbi:MAG: PQQ-binding-like beta-propeller repeat protein [Candidatus Promineifilaceae bacterium]